MSLGSGDAEVQRLACEQTLAAMAPLLKTRARVDQPCDLAAVRKLAKEFGGAATTALKTISALLPASQPVQPFSASASAAHARLADVAACALDCLDHLRPALKSKGLELESQRYGFIRRFAASGLHHVAVAQGWRLRSYLMAAADGVPRHLVARDLGDLKAASVCSLMASLVEILSWPVLDARLAALDPHLLYMLGAAIADAESIIIVEE